MKRILMYCTSLLFLLIFPLALKAQKKVTDIDGNVYRTVKIGTQIWMAENLKTTKYRNGEPIPNVINNAQWASSNTGAYCWYNNNSANKSTYGALYNWYAVSDIRNIAPVGWHVATDADWTILTIFLNGEGVAGGKLKESGTAHWKDPNQGATNNNGFTALPGGGRVEKSKFDYMGLNGAWWAYSVVPRRGEFNIGSTSEWNRYISYISPSIYRVNINKHYGYSVRCILD